MKFISLGIYNIQEKEELHWRIRSRQSVLVTACFLIGLSCWLIVRWTCELQAVLVAGIRRASLMMCKIELRRWRAREVLVWHLHHWPKLFGRQEEAKTEEGLLLLCRLIGLAKWNDRVLDLMCYITKLWHISSWVYYISLTSKRPRDAKADWKKKVTIMAIAKDMYSIVDVSIIFSHNRRSKAWS